MRLPRASGVLLHPTSLPGRHGIGDLGQEAHAFVEFLAESGQRWWQMLPRGPNGVRQLALSVALILRRKPAADRSG